MYTGIPLYLLTGMTPDDRIFKRLAPLLPNSTIIHWLEPESDESLSEYAQRLAATIPDSDCFVAGVSFGGIVAVELSRVIRPRGCFLISSIRSPRELPPWFRICRVLSGLKPQYTLNAAGCAAAVVPRRIRTHSTTRAAKLAGTAGRWHRWATSAVLRWKPAETAPGYPVCHIHGDRDTTFPVRYTDPDVVIKNGGHVLPLTHAGDVAKAIRSVMADSATAVH